MSLDQDYTSQRPNYSLLSVSDNENTDDATPGFDDTVGTAHRADQKYLRPVIPTVRTSASDQAEAPGATKTPLRLGSEPFFAGGFAGELQSIGFYRSGGSWTVMKKDYKTGIITRFTQSGNAGYGRLEVIQGDPLSGPPTNEEVRRRPMSVANGVTLSDDLQKAVATFYLEGNPTVERNGFDSASLQTLLVDPSAVETAIKQERIERIAELNRSDHQSSETNKSASVRANASPPARFALHHTP